MPSNKTFYIFKITKNFCDKYRKDCYLAFKFEDDFIGPPGRHWTTYDVIDIQHAIWFDTKEQAEAFFTNHLRLWRECAELLKIEMTINKED